MSRKMVRMKLVYDESGKYKRAMVGDYEVPLTEHELVSRNDGSIRAVIEIIPIVETEPGGAYYVNGKNLCEGVSNAD